MKTQPSAPASIDDYIAAFPPAVQEILQRIRQVIREEAPTAQEDIRYQMPTFRLNGNLVHFAAYQHHIGFYPTPNGIAEFEHDLAAYKGGKGSARFPLNQPIPYDLIRRIVRFRVAQSQAKAAKSKR